MKAKEERTRSSSIVARGDRPLSPPSLYPLLSGGEGKRKREKKKKGKEGRVDKNQKTARCATDLPAVSVCILPCRKGGKEEEREKSSLGCGWASVGLPSLYFPLLIGRKKKEGESLAATASSIRKKSEGKRGGGVAG